MRSHGRNFTFSNSWVKLVTAIKNKRHKTNTEAHLFYPAYCFLISSRTSSRTNHKTVLKRSKEYNTKHLSSPQYSSSHVAITLTPHRLFHATGAPNPLHPKIHIVLWTSSLTRNEACNIKDLEQLKQKHTSTNKKKNPQAPQNQNSPTPTLHQWQVWINHL